MSIRDGRGVVYSRVRQDSYICYHIENKNFYMFESDILKYRVPFSGPIKYPENYIKRGQCN